MQRQGGLAKELGCLLRPSWVSCSVFQRLHSMAFLALLSDFMVFSLSAHYTPAGVGALLTA